MKAVEQGMCRRQCLRRVFSQDKRKAGHFVSPVASGILAQDLGAAAGGSHDDDHGHDTDGRDQGAMTYRGSQSTEAVLD